MELLPDVHVFDLNKLQTVLPDVHRKLAKAIRQWRDAHSVSADLKVAEDMLDQAMRLELAKVADTDLMKMAILHAAVMAYARGLERHSDHRSTLKLTGHMTPEQRVMHDRLIHLRDESIGHHGPAGTRAPWSEDSVIIIQTGDVWQPAVFARRAIFQREFARHFLLHLQQLQPLVDGIVSDRRDGFQSLFDAAAPTDEIYDLLMQCRMPAEDLARLQEPLLAGARSGRSIGIWQDEA